MAGGLMIIRMGRNIQVILMLKRKVDGGNILNQMDLIIKDIGKTIWLMGKVDITANKIKAFILGNGEKIRSKEWGYYANLDKHYFKNGEMDHLFNNSQSAKIKSKNLKLSSI